MSYRITFEPRIRMRDVAPATSGDIETATEAYQQVVGLENSDERVTMITENGHQIFKEELHQRAIQEQASPAPTAKKPKPKPKPKRR